MTDLGSSTTAASLALTAFWGMVTLGRILFAAIEAWFPSRLTYHVLPLVLAGAFVLVALLPDDQPAFGIAAFALAGLGCSALLPLTISFGQRELSAYAAAAAGGVIAFYQLGYGIAAFGVGPLRDAGVELSTVYATGGDRGDRDVRLVVRRRRPSVELALRGAPRIGSTMTAPSGEQVEIASGDQRAVVVEVGGGLRTYSAGGRAFLDGYGPDEMSRSGRGQVLIPWPNRLEDGGYEFDGRRHQAPIDDLAENAAIHGLVRWAAWTARPARAGVRRDGASDPSAARLPVLPRAPHRVHALRLRPHGHDGCDERRGRSLPVRLAARIPISRSARSRSTRSSCAPPAPRSSRPTSGAFRRGGRRSRGRSTTSAGRDRSARRGSTAASLTSSAATTVAPASS